MQKPVTRQWSGACASRTAGHARKNTGRAAFFDQLDLQRSQPG